MSDASPPREPPGTDRSYPRFRVIFLFWTGFGVFFGMRSYLNHLLFGLPKQVDPVWMVEALLDGWYWVALTFPIFWLAYRFRFSRRGWPLAVAVHAVAATAAALGNIGFDVVAARVLEGVWAPFSAYFRATFHADFQWYLLMLGAAYSFSHLRRLREGEVRAARLDERLAQARLEALKMQIQPHFLFNTLHTISELIHEDPDAAERMITRLGDLLRLTVDNAQSHEVTLAAEMDFLEAYLEIQRTRFNDRLEVLVSVEPETRGAMVPNLVLQPLVENAIRHGTASLGGRGRILVKTFTTGGRLRMEVHDNGAGVHADPRPRARQGVGVRNTRARLEQMYGDEAVLELTHCPIGGTIAAVEIPYRLAPASEAQPVEIPA